MPHSFDCYLLPERELIFKITFVLMTDKETALAAIIYPPCNRLAVNYQGATQPLDYCRKQFDFHGLNLLDCIVVKVDKIISL